jgi:hypothetical protein
LSLDFAGHDEQKDAAGNQDYDDGRDHCDHRDQEHLVD